MPFEDQYYKGYYAAPTGKVHPQHEKTNTDYAHGYALHAWRKNSELKPLTSDKGFALKACKQSGTMLESMSSKLVQDEDVVLEAVKQVRINGFSVD